MASRWAAVAEPAGKCDALAGRCRLYFLGSPVGNFIPLQPAPDGGAVFVAESSGHLFGAAEQRHQ